MPRGKKRLDQLVVECGLAPDVARAQALILAGEILINGASAKHAGAQYSLESRIERKASPQFASRAGHKLVAALDSFSINVKGRICADVGVCSGGFTDVLFKREAAKVYAIDVGYGDIDWELRKDSRVILMERTNARTLRELPEKVSFVCIDVSFISVTLILPNVKNWLEQEGDVVVLIKPQFEAPAAKVALGGVVQDPAVHEEVKRVIVNEAEKLGFVSHGLIPSPLKGQEGNQEFLAWFKN